MSQKYLHVFVNAFWNESSGMSGGDKRIIEILRKWGQKENPHFSIIVYAPQKFIDLLVTENISNVKFGCTAKRESEKYGLVFSYICRTLKAIKLISRHDINAVHCFYSTSDYFPDVIPCVVGRVFNKKACWVSLIHHILENYRTRPGNKKINYISYYMQQFSLFVVKKKSDKILYVSPLVYNYLTNNKKIEKNKMERVHNGVDTFLINSITSYQKKEKQYDAIMLSRLVPSKGIYDLPAIWANVLKKNSSARLGIIGSGTDLVKRDFLQLCNQYDVTKQIDLLGFLDIEEAYRYLKSAKMFVFVSREEGWGISIAEAMACGLPVVAFELPVYKYVFPQGIKLVANRDVADMAEQIEFLINNPKERKEIGSDGLRYVQENYEWEKIAQKEIEIISNCFYRMQSSEKA